MVKLWVPQRYAAIKTKIDLPTYDAQCTDELWPHIFYMRLSIYTNQCFTHQTFISDDDCCIFAYRQKHLALNILLFCVALELLTTNNLHITVSRLLGFQIVTQFIFIKARSGWRTSMNTSINQRYISISCLIPKSSLRFIWKGLKVHKIGLSHLWAGSPKTWLIWSVLDSSLNEMCINLSDVCLSTIILRDETVLHRSLH